ncbi:hypothetical protein D3C78_1319300 [compost metagenome]
MNAALSFQISISKIAFKLKRTGCYTCYISRLIINLLYFISMLLAPHNIHTHQHFGPITAFCSTRTSINLKHCIKLIFFSTKHVFKLEFFNNFNCSVKLLLHFHFRNITFFIEIKKHISIFCRCVYYCKLIRPYFLAFNIVKDFFSSLSIIPKSWG